MFGRTVTKEVSNFILEEKMLRVDAVVASANWQETTRRLLALNWSSVIGGNNLAL